MNIIHLQKTRTAINDELREISAEWLKGKGNHELGFVLGSLGLDQPSAKRYFIGDRKRNGESRALSSVSQSMAAAVITST